MLIYPFNELNFQSFNVFLIYLVVAFSPLIEGGTTYYPVAAIEILLLILLLGGLLTLYRGRKILNPASLPLLPILIFLSYSFLVVLWTPYKLPAIRLIFLYHFYFILFYFSVFFHLTQSQFQKQMIRLLIVIGLLEATLGISQYVFFHQRARGTFFNPDFLGEYLAIVFSFVLGLYLDQSRNKPRRGFFGVLLGILVIGIIFSQSRGAALAWTIGISLVLWKRFKYRIVFAWLTVLVLFLLIPNPLQHRFFHDYHEDPYSFSRFDMWKGAIRMIHDHPTGVGIDMYPLISPQYSFPIETDLHRYDKVAESPHNEYLRLFSETGVIGGFIFLCGIFLLFMFWIDKKNDSFLHAGILGGIVIFLVHALVDSNFHQPALVITLIVLSSFVLERNSFKFSAGRPPFAFDNSPIRHHVFRLTLCCSFLILAFLIIKAPLGWYYYSKGYDQLKESHDENAETCFKKAIFWDSGNSTYHTALAKVYFKRFEKTNYYGWVFRSLKELDQALVLNPQDGSYYKLKGAIYKGLAIRENKPEHYFELYGYGLTNYNEALKLLPYDASLYVDLGTVEEAMGQFQDAENHYDQAILIEPNFLIAREKKIEILLKTGRKGASLKKYEELNSVYDLVKNRVVTDSEKAFTYFSQEKLEKLFKSQNLRSS